MCRCLCVQFANLRVCASACVCVCVDMCIHAPAPVRVCVFVFAAIILGSMIYDLCYDFHRGHIKLQNGPLLPFFFV